MKLSVLMSVYFLEDPNYFNQSIRSIWDDQVIKPGQIILVENGPLTRELNGIIADWKKALCKKLVIVCLEENRGLARALNVGLRHCSGDYIARMDTDDISMPNRFKDQVLFMDSHPMIDVVGTYLSEIDSNDKTVKSLVKYPLSHDQLFNFFAKRDPLAHPSVMFRKSFFEKAGKYDEKSLLYEDTQLWYQGFNSGCKFANIPIVGIKYRRTKFFYERRRDLKKSIELLKTRIYIINKNLGYGNLSNIYAFLYFFIALSPSFLKRILYKLLR